MTDTQSLLDKAMQHIEVDMWCANTCKCSSRLLLAEYEAHKASHGDAVPVAWRYKSYHPMLNGGWAWGFTADIRTVQPNPELFEPLYTRAQAEKEGRCYFT